MTSAIRTALEVIPIAAVRAAPAGGLDPIFAPEERASLADATAGEIAARWALKRAIAALAENPAGAPLSSIATSPPRGGRVRVSWLGAPAHPLAAICDRARFSISHSRVTAVGLASLEIEGAPR